MSRSGRCRPTSTRRSSPKPFLNYQVIAVASPDHPVTKIEASPNQLRQQTWLLGPSAAEAIGLVPKILRGINVPEEHQQIFQSHAAALEEAKRNKGIALAAVVRRRQDIANGDLKQLPGRSLQAEGVWNALALAERGTPSPAGELIRFMTHPARDPGDAARAPASPPVDSSPGSTSPSGADHRNRDAIRIASRTSDPLTAAVSAVSSAGADLAGPAVSRCSTFRIASSRGIHGPA